MKIRDYYKLTTYTTKNCLKISGIIFTACFSIIWVIAESNNNSGSIIDLIKIFIICFLFGNAFGLFIACLALMEGFRQVKNTISLYDSIPSEIKDRYKLIKTVQQLNPKYNYLKIQINSSKPESPLLVFNKWENPKSLQIIIINNFDGKDFHSLKLEIDEKYKREQIHLTGWGLAKSISWKKKKIPTPSEIENSIGELVTISQKEHLGIKYFHE